MACWVWADDGGDVSGEVVGARGIDYKGGIRGDERRTGVDVFERLAGGCRCTRGSEGTGAGLGVEGSCQNEQSREE